MASSFLELPYDVLCCIVDELSPRDEPDLQALGALALTNSALLDICHKRQFGLLKLNARRVDMPARTQSFVDLLDNNNNLQKYIHSVFFGDNVFYPSLIRNTDVAYADDLQDRSQYHSHFHTKEKVSKRILYDPKYSALVSKALGGLKCLRMVEISFMYVNLDWKLASSPLRESLANLCVQPNLESLRIQGFLGIPPTCATLEVQKFEQAAHLSFDDPVAMLANCSAATDCTGAPNN